MLKFMRNDIHLLQTLSILTLMVRMTVAMAFQVVEALSRIMRVGLFVASSATFVNQLLFWLSFRAFFMA
jgi:hypothetical protein